MTPTNIEAIIVDADQPERLVIRQIPLRAPRAGEITVRVKAISLNRGETKRALTVTQTGVCPGWDFAGVVEAVNGVPDAPPPGARVFGALPIGSWAQIVHAPLALIAETPAGVTDAQAATLPVAGLTALHGLRRGGLILGKKVLVNGATGGVGQLAIQLASAAGARVYSHVRREDQQSIVRPWSTGGIAIGETMEAARRFGPFDLIIDGVGGSALSAAMTMLRKKAVCVTLGRSEGDHVNFNVAGLFDAPGASLQSLVLFDDIAATEPACDGLAILAHQVDIGTVRPSISVEAPWTQVASIARRLVDRAFAGKAVLQVA